jgi:hypothetical protein
MLAQGFTLEARIAKLHLMMTMICSMSTSMMALYVQSFGEQRRFGFVCIAQAGSEAAYATLVAMERHLHIA